MRWRKPIAGGGSRMSVLRQRHLIRRAVRELLDREDFLEIDSPLLVRGTTPDSTITSFAVAGRYLATSTEYQIKRLMAGGFERLYTLTQNFRDRDQGARHNPEFTMLEWARVGADLAAIEHDAENLVWAAHLALGGTGILSYQGHAIDLRRPWAHITIAEATRQATGVSLPDFEAPSIRKALTTANVAIPPQWIEDRRFLFTLLVDHLQHHLGFERPVFVREWPSFSTSSAPEGPGGIAERSELVIASVELSDGFPSLRDVERQRRALERQLELRRLDGSVSVDLDEKYLESLTLGLPAMSGMALGFDRLVMLLTNQPRIETVLAFAWDEL
jgi:lysyl-tRNA synthetase class 2